MNCPNCNRGLSFPPGQNKTKCKCGLKWTRSGDAVIGTDAGSDTGKSGKTDENLPAASPASASGAAGDPPAGAPAPAEVKIEEIPNKQPGRPRDVLV